MGAPGQLGPLGPTWPEVDFLSTWLRLVGQASKRGVIPRLPTGDVLIADIEAWLRADAGDLATEMRRGPSSGGRTTLRVRLHPAASELEISADDTAAITAQATTAEVGPGYHTYMAQVLRRLGADQSITWSDPDAQAGTGDSTGYFTSGDRHDAERGLLVWLHTALSRACDARRRGVSGVPIVDFDGHRFGVDGAIASALGPRDDAWLDRAVADPRVAIEVWPWWADRMDAQYLLNRALCLMWEQARWRPPVNDDERAVVDEILRLLHHAFPLNPDLAYPWREWLELLELSGRRDPIATRIAQEAAGTTNTPLIGYRRLPVTVVHGGWQLTVPGSYAERRTEEEWWGGEGGRSITLAATDTGLDGRPMPPEAFLDQVAGHLGSDVLHHREGQLLGRARLTVDSSSGVEVAVLEGYAAVTGSGAAIRVEIHDPNDWEWALDRWRALRPA